MKILKTYSKFCWTRKIRFVFSVLLMSTSFIAKADRVGIYIESDSIQPDSIIKTVYQLTRPQVVSIYKRLDVCDSIEYRLRAIDSISRMLDMKMSSSSLDSLLNVISNINSDRLTLETNLRKKLQASELGVKFQSNQYTIEKMDHLKTKRALSKTNDELVDLKYKFSKSKGIKNKTWIVISSVGAALIGGIVLASVLK